MNFSEMILSQLNAQLDHCWINTGKLKISGRQILADIDEYTKRVSSYEIKLNRSIIGIAIKTSYEFVISDLMALKNHAITLPIPLDFEDEQIKTLLHNVDYVLVSKNSDGIRLFNLFPNKTIINIKNNVLINKGVGEIREYDISPEIIKIIHTSGTTSNPKGVLIKDKAMVILMNSLMKRFPKYPLHYLSIVPMSLLIEQVLGIYCSLISNGTLTLLPETMPEFGAHFNNSRNYLDLVKLYKPNFMYLAPKLLEEIDKNYDMEGSLENSYVITGGAKVNHLTLKNLYKQGIKVYEGYGLSENSSVISINSIEDWKIGSAGKLLPHINYKIVDGELLIKSETLCAGYFSKDDSACEISNDGYLHTGDLVEFEDEYLVIKGRKKHVLILSNARNISPEWVESKIKRYAEIYDCIIIGDGLDYLCAIIIPSTKEKVKDFNSIIFNVNKELPIFAKIGKIIIIDNIEAFVDTYYTVTGRPKRSLIHKDFIYDCLYKEC